MCIGRMFLIFVAIEFFLVLWMISVPFFASSSAVSFPSFTLCDEIHCVIIIFFTIPPDILYNYTIWVVISEVLKSTKVTILAFSHSLAISCQSASMVKWNSSASETVAQCEIMGELYPCSSFSSLCRCLGIPVIKYHNVY